MAAHPMLGDNPCHGGLVDVVEARDLAPFGGVVLLASTADATLRPSGSGASRGSLPNRRVLELRERADHLHHHAACRGCGVDVLRDRLKVGARLSDPLHDVQHVLQRAGKAVELLDDDRVSFA